jgi:Flp pilus assembly protein CpaB
MADLLAPGDVVDVLATDPRTGLARQVATDVTVLAIPRSATDLSGGPNGDGAMVVLEVDLSQALDLTGAALSEYLTVTL